MCFANRENRIRSWGHGAHPLQSIKVSTHLTAQFVGLILLRGTVQVKTAGSSDPNQDGSVSFRSDLAGSAAAALQGQTHVFVGTEVNPI